MEHLVECGFSPMEAIVAATRDGARVLGIDQRTGTVSAGKEADLIVLDRDPLQDLRAAFEPLLVVANGHVVLNRVY
jgi:imidazolonepropionase-like amidohydrolase